MELIVAVATCAAALTVSLVSDSARPAVAAPTPGTVAAQEVPAEQNVRYYVVEQLPGGEREFLFAIAARTLGDGRRYREIFDLNSGRTQPGGGRLTDPTILEPGWVLVLPDDARGPGVRYGPLPAVDSSPSPTSDQLPADATRQPDRRSELLLPGGAAMAAVGLLALTILVLRRGGGARRPRARTVEPETVPAQPLVRQPGRAARQPTLPVIKPIGAPPTIAPSATGYPAPLPEPPKQPDQPDQPRAGHRPEPSDEPGPGNSSEPPDRPEQAAPRAEQVTPQTQPATPEPTVTTPMPTDTTSTSAVAAPAPVDGERRLPHLEVELRVGDDRAVLRLTGVRQPRAGAPYGWWPTEQADAAPPTVIPVGLGSDGQFWIDLRQAPDVFAVTGSTAARHRAARLLTTRLLAAGAGVTVVGDGVSRLPQDCRRYPADVAALADDTAALTTITLVAEPAPEQLTAIRTLAERANAATVPLVVTAGPSARWTLQMVDD
jgi:hypothetical protein